MSFVSFFDLADSPTYYTTVRNLQSYSSGPKSQVMNLPREYEQHERRLQERRIQFVENILKRRGQIATESLIQRVLEEYGQIR